MVGCVRRPHAPSAGPTHAPPLTSDLRPLTSGFWLPPSAFGPPDAEHLPLEGGNTLYRWKLITRLILSMNLLIILLILLLLFGGGGFYYGGPVYGGSGLGFVLLVIIIIYLVGGFRGKK